MNEYTKILETVGDYRVSITPDHYAEPPDWDGQGTVIQLDTGYTGRTYVMHPRNGDDYSLAYLWERFNGDTYPSGYFRNTDEMQLIERYLRIWRGVVGFDYFGPDQFTDYRYVCIVTEDDLHNWGFDSLADFQRAAAKHDFDPNPAVGNLSAWRDWTEGEVYYYTIEKRAHDPFTVIDWTGSYDDDAAGEDEEGAWETVEQVHGYYGHTDATEQALEAFSGYVSDTEEVPA